MAALAGPTLPAGPDQGHYHRVAHVEARLGGASGTGLGTAQLDHVTGSLMAEDQGELRGPGAVEVAQVGVADSARLDSDADLFGPRGVKGKRFDAWWQADASAHRRTDGDPSARRHGAEPTPR